MKARNYVTKKKMLGEVFVHSGIKQNELFITTKVNNDGWEYNQNLGSFEQSLKNFKTDYLELFIVYWQ